tara:strand:- start:55 stop:708 length:654 start_codon:yes stop_codon:yes gene_type:complete
MRKEEIKKDPIRDKLISTLNQINDNPKPFLTYSTIIGLSLLVFILYNNTATTTLNEHNLELGINQNRYIDGDSETAINNFSTILSTYSKSESYNQALIYSLNDAIETNDIKQIEMLLNDNKFKTSDNTLQSLYFNIIANHYTSMNDYDNAIDYYHKAINTSSVDMHKYQFKLNLLYLLYDNDRLDDYKKMLETIDIDDISSFQMKSKFEQLPQFGNL